VQGECRRLTWRGCETLFCLSIIIIIIIFVFDLSIICPSSSQLYRVE
jgi:hypothetical protein